jgi:hypothetical protein
LKIYEVMDDIMAYAMEYVCNLLFLFLYNLTVNI